MVTTNKELPKQNMWDLLNGIFNKTSDSISINSDCDKDLQRSIISPYNSLSFMQFNTYFINVGNESLTFEFDSVGPKGRIRKRVSFQTFHNEPTVYNLGFGDVDKDDNIDDQIISDNSDGRKVLTTVAYCTGVFFEKHPDAMVYIQGSTPSRTRLYRIGINNNYVHLSKDFKIRGYHNGWQVFTPGIAYEAFLIEKNSKFEL